MEFKLKITWSMVSTAIVFGPLGFLLGTGFVNWGWTLCGIAFCLFVQWNFWMSTPLGLKKPEDLKPWPILPSKPTPKR